MNSESQKDSLERYWAERTLCSDEACIGVIGPDGRCKECGKPYDGQYNNPVYREMEPEPVKNQPEPAKTTTEKTGSGDKSDTDDDWDKRILCSDESCIGIIGPDGRCKECGKPYKG